MRVFGSMLRNERDRQGFWYSALIGVFLGLLMGSAFTSILGIVRAHDAYKASLALRQTGAGSPMPLHRGPLAPTIQGFVDQTGKAVTTADLLGKVRVVTFLSPLGNRYSPLLVSNLMNLYQELKDDGMLGKRVIFVSYNVDPAHTGQGEMSAFLKRIAGLDPSTSSWRFLTAKPAVVRKVVSGGYGVHYRQLSPREYATFTAEQRKNGEYLYADAVNPLTNEHKPNYHVVDHDEIMIVGPRNHIWMRIHHASSFPNGDLMRFIATLLRLPGMPGLNTGRSPGGL